MYTKEKNTEKSKLTDNAEKINCEACYEPCIFELKDSVHTFNIGLLDILKCIKFAEDEGIVPKYLKNGGSLFHSNSVISMRNGNEMNVLK